MILHDSDYKSLSIILLNTCKNVYSVVNRLFNGYKWTDSDFDKLDSIANIKRCVECNTWLESSVIQDDTCEECTID